MTAVSVRGLTKRFAEVLAVDGIDFSIDEASIFGFLGPNGAGKTTTLRMICGVLAPDAGSGQVLGLDLLSQSEAIRSRLGYMSQRFSLYEELTARQNLEFYAQIYGVPAHLLEERRQELNHLLHLEGAWEEPVSGLPGGARQRVAFACAQVHHPPLLLLDEPTDGMDPLSRLHFWDTLYRLADEGSTIMVTTHFMDEAEHCDQLALIDRGRLIARGSPQELRRELEGRVLEVQAEPWPDALRLAEQEHQVSLRGISLRVVLAEQEAPEDLVRQLLRGGIRLENVSQVEATMEDVFIAKLGRPG